jgi:hypothetical protein
VGHLLARERGGEWEKERGKKWKLVEKELKMERLGVRKEKREEKDKNLYQSGEGEHIFHRIGRSELKHWRIERVTGKEMNIVGGGGGAGEGGCPLRKLRPKRIAKFSVYGCVCVFQ